MRLVRKIFEILRTARSARFYFGPQDPQDLQDFFFSHKNWPARSARFYFSPQDPQDFFFSYKN